MVLRGVVLLVVDAEADGEVLPLAGRRDDHFSRAGLEVLLGVGLGSEPARALQRHLHAVLLVRQLGGVPLRADRDAVAVDHHRVLGGLDRAVKNPVHRVVLEHVCKGLRLVDVVQQHHVEITRAALDGSAEYVAADASKAVDGEASHVLEPPWGRHT